MSEKDTPTVAEVIASIFEGYSLDSALKMHKVSRQKFYQVISEDPQLQNEYTRARLSRADLLAEQVLTAADSDDDPAKVRNQILARQWYASKTAPQTYGDRMDLNLNQTVDLTAAILEAKKRALLHGRFTDEVSDAEVIEPKRISDARTTGPEPDVPTGKDAAATTSEAKGE